MDTPIYKRQGAYLPHWTRSDATYAVTFRLADSLPTEVLNRIRIGREDIVQRAEYLERPLTEHELNRLAYLHSERIEAYLDAGHGSCWMKEPRVAAVVRDAILHFGGDRYSMIAWCVMPNHVHAVFKPHPTHTLENILHSWKSFTSKSANKLLARSGEFWMPEYYDHLIRDQADLEHAIRYVLANPQKAGLRDWPWVST